MVIILKLIIYILQSKIKMRDTPFACFDQIYLAGAQQFFGMFRTIVWFTHRAVISYSKGLTSLILPPQASPIL